MKDILRIIIIVLLFLPVVVSAETIETRIGSLSFTHDFANGYPTKETVEKLYDERDFQRACQAYVWALPIVSFAQFQKEVRRNVPELNDCDFVLAIGYEAVMGTLTPNVVTPYMNNLSDLGKTGPLVLEIPAGASAGVINDFWQRPVTDLGLAGPDQGKGGKYLLLGPGQTVPQTEEYIVARSSTINVFVLLRVLETDPGKAERLQRQIRLYPYAQRDNPPATRVVRPSRGVDQAQPRGLAFWELLVDILYREPVQERDRIMMAMLRPLGIEKGKPFHPDEQQKKILTEAALVGEAMTRANDFEKRQMELSHYREGVHWHFALCLDPSQEAEFYTQLDERAAWFYEATGSSKGMVTKTPGVGQVYLGSYKDKDGNWLDGANNYRLHVPPDAPVKQFWSLTVYDVNTRSLVQNEQKLADRSSRQPDLLKNADGSVDLYVGPTAPKGSEKNWIPSVPGRAWFAYFRLYAPTEAHFNKTWTLPDFEKVK